MKTYYIIQYSHVNAVEWQRWAGGAKTDKNETIEAVKKLNEGFDGKAVFRAVKVTEEAITDQEPFKAGE